MTLLLLKSICEYNTNTGGILSIYEPGCISIKYNNILMRQQVVGYVFTMHICVDNILQYDYKKYKL
jgi:hypothetical protein